MGMVGWMGGMDASMYSMAYYSQMQAMADAGASWTSGYLVQPVVNCESDSRVARALLC